MAAELQERFKVKHPVGIDVTKQIIMVLRKNNKNNNEVIPETYMISDQGQSLIRDRLLLPPTDRKMLKLKQSNG